MAPEGPSQFEMLTTVPFIEIAHSKEDAMNFLTEKTRLRAQNILLNEIFGGIDPSSISSEFVQNAHISANEIVREYVRPGGRKMNSEFIEGLYADYGIHTFKAIIDDLSKIMASRLFHPIPGQLGKGKNDVNIGGVVVSARDSLGIMLDALDLVKAFHPGMRVIAESLHTQGVPAFDIGFGVYNMQNPRVTTSGSNRIRAEDLDEFRLDPYGAQVLKQIYLHTAPKYDSRRVAFFASGERSAKQARLINQTSRNR